MVSLPFQVMASMSRALFNLAVKVRVYPTVAREELLAKTLGCKWWIWNHWLEDWTARENESLEKNETSPSSIHLPWEPREIRCLDIVEGGSTRPRWSLKEESTPFI
ncbi:helix-turn-helix domain-containing protein [Candidatus Bathyarchaeota archaeon]|nr:helix-turn-helix domain-containing protein [Candidatus Bathyarchaeota archaeon]